MIKSALALVLAALCCSAAAIPASGSASGTAAKADSTNRWGYGYDSLLLDLAEWRKHPEVRIDSIGASVQGRAIWMVSITDAGDSLGPVDDSSSKKRRIFIHARTHPAEVQAHYVAKEAIAMLLDSGAKAEELKRGFIFNIVPMYNPDGVELGHARLNAHLMDLEVNWNKGVLEPEVTALKKQFEAFQASPVPVEVALNLHSDQYNCTRFFFFHFAAGTSPYYENLERAFIGGVQSHFPGGIKNWDFVRSWGDSTETKYPEGFWWKTRKEDVLALTYEDTNCPNAGRFDSTGRALVLGSSDFLRNRWQVGVKRFARDVSRMLLLPGGVRIAGEAPGSRWELNDLRGRRLAGGVLGAGTVLIAWSELPAAPIRILSIARRSGPAERIRLPVRPE
ncbi:MAG TPA: M14 family zinc carboxypeptidase [Fibrobacteria bacterium]|nr:M14 family zinc carboxypeptidase [Fibrobacteria bacterium]